MSQTVFTNPLLNINKKTIIMTNQFYSIPFYGNYSMNLFFICQLQNLLQSLISHPHSVEAALKDSYAVTDSQIAEAKIQFSGTTTVSALLRVEQDGSKRLYVANVGDARAILKYVAHLIDLRFFIKLTC